VIDPDTFRSVLGRFASGVTIVSCFDEAGAPQGMTVSAFCSLSLRPALVLVCIDRTATVLPALRQAGGFAINILGADQEALSRRFAKQELERFEGVGFSKGANGNPILEDVLAHLECRTTAQQEAGDHVIFFGEVSDAAAHDGRPLMYYRGGYAQLER
jgi:flavin reductase (DIM6/NTAB) family NADH-FMN oxidoreductase RutF